MDSADIGGIASSFFSSCVAFSSTSGGMPGSVDLLLQLVELALFAAPQFLLDRLDLLVQVVLFLRPLHLPLHPRLDGAVHVQLFNLDVQHVGDAVQPVCRVEDLQQLLLLLDRQLQVGGNRVAQPPNVVQRSVAAIVSWFSDWHSFTYCSNSEETRCMVDSTCGVSSGV